MEGYKEGKRESSLDLDDKNPKLTLSEKEEKVSESLEKAKDLRKKGEYEDGIDLLLEALKLGVDQDKVYYRLGNIYYDSGDLDRAEYSYERAIEENEKHINAQHNLAVVYKKQGKIRKSVKQRKKASKMELKNPREPNLSEDEKGHAKWFAKRFLLLTFLGVAAIGGLIYLLVRFL